jgi:hypothetical protein
MFRYGDWFAMVVVILARAQFLPSVWQSLGKKQFFQQGQYYAEIAKSPFSKLFG